MTWSGLAYCVSCKWTHPHCVMTAATMQQCMAAVARPHHGDLELAECGCGTCAEAALPSYYLQVSLRLWG